MYGEGISLNFKEMFGEFANTFTEIHYLVGGGCVGFVLGWIAGSLFTKGLL